MRKFIDVLITFAIGLGLVLYNVTLFYVFAGTVTGVIVLYTILAITVLPTLKKTIPTYFGDFVALNFNQIVRNIILIVCAWAPITLILGEM